MKYKEIYFLAETAEQALDILEGYADSYKHDVDDFYHTEEIGNGYSHTRPVSGEMLRESTMKIAEIIPEHQKIMHKLEYSLDTLEQYTWHWCIQGEKVDPQELESRIEELIEDYQEVFESIWNTGIRLKKDSEVHMDPIETRYNLWKKERRKQMEKKEVPGEALDRIFSET